MRILLPFLLLLPLSGCLNQEPAPSPDTTSSPTSETMQNTLPPQPQEYRMEQEKGAFSWVAGYNNPATNSTTTYYMLGREEFRTTENWTRLWLNASWEPVHGESWRICLDVFTDAGDRENHTTLRPWPACVDGTSTATIPLHEWFLPAGGCNIVVRATPSDDPTSYVDQGAILNLTWTADIQYPLD